MTVTVTVPADSDAVRDTEQATVADSARRRVIPRGRHVTSRHVTSRHVTSRHVTSRHAVTAVTPSECHTVAVTDPGRRLRLPSNHTAVKGRIQEDGGGKRAMPPPPKDDQTAIDTASGLVGFVSFNRLPPPPKTAGWIRSCCRPPLSRMAIGHNSFRHRTGGSV